jgi:glycerol uptake facilitator protein
VAIPAVVAIGMAWGTDAGYAITPARDLGPRLASYLTGCGGAWRDQYGSLYFWVPVVGPLVGGLVGAAGYKSLVGRHRPDVARQEPGQVPAARGEG